MPGTGIMAFAEDDGYFLDRSKSMKWHGIPIELKKKFNRPEGVLLVMCVAFGTGGNYFCTWKGKDQVASLTNYPGLDSYIRNEEGRKQFNYSKFHVSLGPNNSWYVNNPVTGQMYHGLDAGLEREIVRRLSPENIWDGDPVHITLGCGGSYVLIGKKGDIFWDLKGNYVGLENKLRESKVGVINVTLSPFDSTRYYVLFKDRTAFWHGPMTWNFNLNVHS